MDENKRGNKYRATFPLRQNEMSIERSLILSSGTTLPMCKKYDIPLCSFLLN
jgi:hypothetical protein